MAVEEKINGWTFEETVKTAENLMESEQNMFKWDVLQHLRDFAENYREELEEYRAIGTPEECQAAMEKQTAKKPIAHQCLACGNVVILSDGKYCCNCGQKLDWSE